MKIFFKMLTAAALTTAASGCSSFLDINTNPNNPTAVTPDAILATALSTTAQTYTGGTPSAQNAYNGYASWVASYWGRAGGVSGYGEEITYNYSSTFYNALFDNTYDNLNDYQLIQNQAATYPNHAAIARIMKVYNYLLLVDEFGDVPYTNALLGAANVTPTYDKAADIYKDLLVQLTGAITDINAVTAGARSVGGEDIVFAGNMTNWKRLANSLKLRILMRESQTSDATLNASIATQMTALQTATDGFILTDVVSQPGYAQNTNQQNPLYNRFAFTVAGTGATERSYQLPTQYIIDQYLNNNDPRVSQYYVLGGRWNGTAAVPQYIGAVPGEASSPNFNTVTAAAPIMGSRFLGSNTAGVTGAIFKGLNAPTVLMTLSEIYFLRAEAETRGLFTGGDAAAKTDYQYGILSAFLYAYRSGTATPIAATAATTATAGFSQYTTYLANNTSNPLVSYDAASSSGTLGKQAVILYQKYLALNSIASVEAWDDYRRAAQPKLPASTQSGIANRADKLPTRLLYPLSESSTNGANIPVVTNTTKIFWDVVD